MKQQKQNWLPIAFIANFFAVGIPYWLIPYNTLNLPNALMGWGLVLVGVSALLLCACKATSFWRVVRVVGAAVPAAVLARVLVDVVKDSTSHNLWPLEIIISSAVGCACSLAGAVVGSLMARFIAGPGSGEKF